jgi:hypothetical protein
VPIRKKDPWAKSAWGFFIVLMTSSIQLPDKCLAAEHRKGTCFVPPNSSEADINAEIQPLPAQATDAEKRAIFARMVETHETMLRRELFQAFEVDSRSASPGPTLGLAVDGSSATLALSSLRSYLPLAELTVYNPVYKKKMHYQGFWLDELLACLHIHPKERDVVFQAADSYATALAAGEIGKRRWLVAFGEKSGQWTPLPDRKPTATPAPWYVVGATLESFKDFPWPFQVIKIQIRDTF